MDILEKVRASEKIKDFFYRFCDFELYETFTDTCDLNGEMKFTMKNKAFGMAGDGTEFLILEDGTIGMSGSEGDAGRIADSMNDFFSLLLNFPCFWDFLCYNIYLDKNKELFRAKLAEAMEEYSTDPEFEILKAETAEKLGIQLDNDVVNNTAVQFYNTVMRNPRFGYYYKDVLYDELFCECFWC